MSNIGSWVGVIGGLFGLVAIIAAALVYLRMGMAKTTIDLYKEDNEALRKRQETLESDNNRLALSIKEFEFKIKALEEERTVLRDLATGKTAMENLATLLTQQSGEQKQRDSQIITLLEQLIEKGQN